MNPNHWISAYLNSRVMRLLFAMLAAGPWYVALDICESP